MDERDKLLLTQSIEKLEEAYLDAVAKDKADSVFAVWNLSDAEARQHLQRIGVDVSGHVGDGNRVGGIVVTAMNRLDVQRVLARVFEGEDCISQRLRDPAEPGSFFAAVLHEDHQTLVRCRAPSQGAVQRSRYGAH
jgi:hypothetical protein